MPSWGNVSSMGSCKVEQKKYIWKYWIFVLNTDFKKFKKKGARGGITSGYYKAERGRQIGQFQFQILKTASSFSKGHSITSDHQEKMRVNGSA